MSSTKENPNVAPLGRYERRHALPVSPLSSNGRKVLRAVLDLVASGQTVRLADVNRALGELPDHYGGWGILRAIRRRKLINWTSTLANLTVDVDAARRELDR